MSNRLSHEADRHIQSNAIHPRGERPRWIVARPSAPQLRDYLLDQVGAIVGMPAVGIGHLEDDGLMRLQEGFKLLLALFFHDVAGFLSSK